MAGDRFLGLTKTQFAGLSATLSLFATGLAVLTLVVGGIRAHEATCQAVNSVNTAIRHVLAQGIAQGKAELKDPRFAPFKTQIEQSIALDQQYESALFSNRHC